MNIGRVPNRSLAEFREEVIPFHELHRYGFKMMLIDLIEAPEPMLRYFCRYHNLHQIPIAEALSPEQIERVKRGLPKLSLFFTMSTRVCCFVSLHACMCARTNNYISIVTDNVHVCTCEHYNIIFANNN